MIDVHHSCTTILLCVYLSLVCVRSSEDVQNDDGSDSKGVRLPIDVRLCDFDDVAYRVVIDAAALNIMKVSMSLPCWSSIAPNGGETALNTIYGPLVQAEPESGYDLTLVVDLDNLPAGETQASLVDKIAKFKPNIVGGAFDHHFQALIDGKTSNTSTGTRFNLRNDTTVFLFPRADRVTVVYSLEFNDRVDSAIAKVFMQEFVDARRKMGAAPPCTFGVNPPLEMKEFGITEPTGNLGFISFAVLKQHLDGARKTKVIDVLTTFRNYVQYHLKCSKSYFHSRMRARVVSLLKILNRAKVVNPDEKEKKTISGKVRSGSMQRAQEANSSRLWLRRRSHSHSPLVAPVSHSSPTSHRPSSAPRKKTIRTRPSRSASGDATSSVYCTIATSASLPCAFAFIETNSTAHFHFTTPVVLLLPSCARSPPATACSVTSGLSVIRWLVLHPVMAPTG